MEKAKERIKSWAEGLNRGEAAAFLIAALAGTGGTETISPLGPAVACSAWMGERYRLSAALGGMAGALLTGRWTGLMQALMLCLLSLIWQGRRTTRWDRLLLLGCGGLLCFPFFYVYSLAAAMEGLGQVSLSIVCAAGFFRAGRGIDRARLGQGIGERDMTALFLTAGALCFAASGFELMGINPGGILGAFLTASLCGGAGVYSVALGAVTGAGVVLGGGEAAFGGAAAIAALGASSLRGGGRFAVCCGFVSVGAVCAYFGGAPEAAIEIALGTAACALLPRKFTAALGRCFRFGRSEAEQRLNCLSGRVKDVAVVLDRVSALFEECPESEAELFAGRQLRCVSQAISDIPEPVREENLHFGLKCGAAACPKAGSGEAGDSMAVRELGRGKLVLLSDGMGSGAVARRESGAAVSLVGDLVSIGVKEMDALDCVNRLLMYKGEYDMYATVDAMTFDYATGQACFLKLGAPPSFILREGAVIELRAETLPIGIVAAAKPAMQDMRLERGDMVIMTTDGITDALGSAMARCVSALPKDDPEAAARELLKAASAGEIRDDMSVIAARVC